MAVVFYFSYLAGMTALQHSNQVLDTVRARTKRVILFYSAGKDSITLLDLAAKKFDHVTCAFMYFVKGLEHIEKYFEWSKKRYPNVDFIQLPHYGMATIYKQGLYCTPNTNITRQTNLDDIDRMARKKAGIDFTLYGWKQADSLNRRLALRQYEMEAINMKTRKGYPLSHWKKGDVLAYLKLNKLPQPVMYGTKNSGGIGFNADCLVWMRKHYPQDLQTFLTKFPLAERLIFEYDSKSKTGTGEGQSTFRAKIQAK
jgi:3'-phosphoadenosine 5'-phosphosulfate sulfotransferase (PAPS reductase)/FAD synthetase